MNFQGWLIFFFVVLLFLLEFNKLQVQIKMGHLAIGRLFGFKNSTEDGVIKYLFL